MAARKKKATKRTTNGATDEEQAAPVEGETAKATSDSKPSESRPPKVDAEPESPAPKRGRLLVTKASAVVLSNFVGTLAQGRELREENYAPADWSALCLVGKRHGWRLEQG